MLKTSYESLGEDCEEEESDSIKVFPAPVGESEGTGGPTLAKSDPSLLAIMQHITHIIGNLQEDLRPPALNTLYMQLESHWACDKMVHLFS
ncbi:hypothetical protein O181_024956 [Austropuccinia psidii MF-1]|uniref:Uncharacterized protein n=1 Tax=Austropuccinia psidii MF-1 TaxID=1389203 RepID=A0A9Q3CMG4_9BASI|nr:hypothetical protein [Austropuccinia psidii MF-1]